MNTFKRLVLRAIVPLLARWGYTVTHRDPTVLQCEQRLDPRMLALEKDYGASASAYARNHAERNLCAAMAKFIVWERWEDPQYTQTVLRGALHFYPVVSK